MRQACCTSHMTPSAPMYKLARQGYMNQAKVKLNGHLTRVYQPIWKPSCIWFQYRQPKAFPDRCLVADVGPLAFSTRPKLSQNSSSTFFNYAYRLNLGCYKSPFGDIKCLATNRYPIILPREPSKILVERTVFQSSRTGFLPSVLIWG